MYARGTGPDDWEADARVRVSKMRHQTEDAFMVPGMGAQPVPVKEWVAANDNHPDWNGIAQNAVDRFPTVHETLVKSERGQYIGIPRPGDPNGCADDLVTTTFAPLEELPVAKQPASEWLTEEKKKEIYDWLTQPLGEHAALDERAGNSVTIDVAIDGCGKLVPSVRHGSFMQTFTGRKFWPMDPRANEVCIRDIAHSLSLQCRYAGHCRRFYSVAEHCVHIARWLVGVDRGAALWGLLHDASEAYLIDVPRPVKPFLTGYKAAESNVMAAVCARFGLPIEMPAAVHEADERIIADELVNLVRMQWHARHDDPLCVTLRYWSPEEAEVEFLETFKALTGAVGEVG